MPRVNLPPGAYGVKFAGAGTTPNVRPGSSVQITDEQARMIKKSSNGELGIISGSQAMALGTKAGRWCQPCRFLAQAWSTQCPRCGGPTEKE
jgi:hypothetical protein